MCIYSFLRDRNNLYVFLWNLSIKTGECKIKRLLSEDFTLRSRQWQKDFELCFSRI